MSAPAAVSGFGELSSRKERDRRAGKYNHARVPHEFPARHFREAGAHLRNRQAYAETCWERPGEA